MRQSGQAGGHVTAGSGIDEKGVSDSCTSTWPLFTGRGGWLRAGSRPGPWAEALCAETGRGAGLGVTAQPEGGGGLLGQ